MINCTSWEVAADWKCDENHSKVLQHAKISIHFLEVDDIEYAVLITFRS